LEEDRELFNKNLAENSQGYSMRKRYIRPDNSVVWVNMTIAHLNIDSRPELSHVCIIEDISDQVQAEINLKEGERNKAMQVWYSIFLPLTLT
jgi:PAS domain S-box-containing protein